MASDHREGPARAQLEASFTGRAGKPDSRVTATSTVYVQPRWDAFDDTRVLFETALVTAIGKRLALKFLATVMSFVP